MTDFLHATGLHTSQLSANAFRILGGMVRLAELYDVKLTHWDMHNCDYLKAMLSSNIKYNL